MATVAQETDATVPLACSWTSKQGNYLRDTWSTLMEPFALEGKQACSIVGGKLEMLKVRGMATAAPATGPHAMPAREYRR